MKKSIKPLLLLIVLTVVSGGMFLAMPSTTYACMCPEPQPVEEHLENMDAVFVGHLLEFKKVENAAGIYRNDAIFEVSEIWKGSLATQVNIRTGFGGGDCGFSFIEGKKYLVYASYTSFNGDENQLETNRCFRTKLVSEAEEDLAILGAGEAPTLKVKLTQSKSFLNKTWTIAVSAAVVAAIIGTGVYFRRRKTAGKE